VTDSPEDIANEMALIPPLIDECDETWEPEGFETDDHIPGLDLAVKKLEKAVRKLAEITEPCNRRPGAQGLPVLSDIV
jgi:hypothetical protein